MRAAPPVSVRCTGGWVWRGLLVGAPAAAAAALAMWAAGHAGVTPWPALPIALAVAVGAAWRLPADTAQLFWDGQVWQVDGMGGRMAVMIDLGPWLLLRWAPAAAGRPEWIAVADVAPPASWHGLRAALYCRANTAATQPAPSSPSPQPD